MRVFDKKIWNNCDGFQYGDTLTAIKAGSYNSGTGTWTDGNSNYSFNRNGNRITVEGTIPYAAADATLGLPAGNRLMFKMVNEKITAKADLPAGDIVTTIGKNGTNTYTKDAFESDGSLINIFNVYKDFISKIKIKWEDGVETTYEIDCSNATTPQE